LTIPRLAMSWTRTDARPHQQIWETPAMINASAAIEALETQRVEALINSDVFTLRSMTHKDYVHIDARGQLRTKDEFLSSISSGKVQMLFSEISGNRIQFHGDTAIVTGIFTNRIRTPSADESRSGRHCRVYIFEDHSWQNVLHQGTEYATT
jgi:hypothetical protein